MILALLGLMMGGLNSAFAQKDSAQAAEEPKDTISIDNMDPKFYEEEAPGESSNSTMTYALVGGIVVVAGAAFYFLRKKKK